MLNFGEGDVFFRSPKESHRNSPHQFPGPDHNNRQGRLPQDRPRSAPLGKSQGGGVALFGRVGVVQGIGQKWILQWRKGIS